jgi:hypothetical protein
MPEIELRHEAPAASPLKAAEPKAIAPIEVAPSKPKPADPKPAADPIADRTYADRDCGDFGSQAEAQRFFITNGGPSSDPHKLDRDNDGIACETI